MHNIDVKILVQLVISTITVLVAANILPGVHVANIMTALIVAIVFGVLNAVLKPILVLLTLPITILTLGLFLVILNIVLVFATASIVPGFQVDGIFQALLFVIIVSLVGGFLQKLA
jgi:putative membrane protein